MAASDESSRVSGILAAAVSKGLINDDCPSIDVFDLDYFNGRLTALKKAFPEDFILNAVAVKANPVRGILAEAQKRGFGAECASISEVVHSLSLNFPPEDVVYDSPIKTRPDLERAIKAGVVINLDNEYEMAIVEDLLSTTCSGSSPASIGLRINPVVGSGSIDMMSTATKASKFGLPVTEHTGQRVIDLYKKYNWLNGIHFHVGSQGVELPLFVSAAKFCMKLVKEIESFCGRDLKAVDIGGGLSTSYVSSTEPESSSFALYRSELEASAPELFSGKYRMITEFGRSLFLKAGLTFTRIEYIKNWVPEIRPILLTHVGSNQFIREAYVGGLWTHRHSLASKDGVIKTGGPTTVYDVGGPLCFQGDFLAKNVELPEVEAGDILIVHDTGAYTFSLYSKYNSILPSAVYGFAKKSDGGDYEIRCFKERETSEEALQFWGSLVPRII